ncbi:alpha/beta hydrolase [Listeria valentina]|uniref:alpha/beta hydrolase n=1 Tax=Listeria valentina TaxID=2705293 RepID=UPI00142F569F|nr:alpha/beta hydrolase [Listeria valentina]
MFKRILFAGILPCLCVVIALFALTQLNDSHEEMENQQIPSVFIHGYKGTDRSLHGMIRRFDQKYHWGTDSLVIRVSASGKITESGHYRKSAKNPLINVVFENNRASLTQQALWTKKVMLFLKQQHGIMKFNAIGHSMGGGAFISYLAAYEKNENYPQVNKIVFLGVPFYPEEYINGEESVTLKNAPMIHTKFAKKMAKILPKDIQIMIVGGDILDGTVSDGGTASDGVVSLSSVLYGKQLFTEQPLKVHIVKGREATHTNLHELPQIDAYIGHFLFSNSK